jgi:hypothetical protein
MVVHWWKERQQDPKWYLHASVNGLGALITGIVLVVISVTKFMLGAWMIILLIPIVVIGFLVVRGHYSQVADNLRMDLSEAVQPVRHTIVVPVAGVNRAVAHAVAYAMTLSDDVRVVHVATDPEAAEKLQAKWNTWNPGVSLTVLPSPYRSIMRPLLEYIDSIERKETHDVVTIIVPEFVPKRLWHHLLHNQSALLLRTALHFRRNTVLVSVPYHLEQ